MYSTECIHKYEKRIQLKMKKQQQANKGNSMQQLTCYKLNS